MKTLGIKVLGTAEKLPRRIVPTAEVAARCGVSEEEAINRTGVKTRRWLSADEDPLAQGLAAAEQAIKRAGLSANDIDVVINASGTPMQAIPDGGALLAAELGLQGKFGFSVHATCISFLVALHQAALQLAAGLAENILIVSTEAGSRGLNFQQPESAILIGDAAAAVVVGRADHAGQGIVASRFSTDITGIRDAEIRGFGSRIPVQEAAERPADFTFDMQGLRLLRGAMGWFPAFLKALQAEDTGGLDSLDWIIPHQTSKAGMEMMSRYWGWDNMMVTLAEVGNTIAASIPLALHRADIQPGQKAMLIGTGAGTHYGALIVQW